MSFTIHKVTGKYQRWFLSERKDFHTQYGVIKKEKIKPGTVRMRNNTFVITPAQFSDAAHAMKRDAQIITRKDIGFIIAYCGLGKSSVVVESGSGSGGATLLLANVCKQVYSYDIREEHLAIVRENIKRVGLKNITVKRADFYKSRTIPKREADMVLLDLQEPWLAIPTAKKSVKLGGYVVAYTPQVTQAQQFVMSLPKEWMHEKTLELMNRDWQFSEQTARPVNAAIGHTAFLTFCRRIR